MTEAVRLFVYGTLAPGDDAWSVLEPWTIGDAVADSAPGTLYDTGRGYPAATFADGAPNRVHGVVVELDPISAGAALTTLDRYEGDGYDRVRVTTDAGMTVFAYGWRAPLTGCTPVPDGVWAGG